VRYRHGEVDSLRAVDATLPELTKGLTDPVLDKDWIGWYEHGFSWDEKRFLSDMRPGEADFGHNSRFWTATDAWERSEAKDKSSIHFVRMAQPERMWKSVILFDYSYLRITPHRYWWGQTAQLGNARTMSVMPPEKATWRHLGVEKQGGEMCDVVDS